MRDIPSYNLLPMHAQVKGALETYFQHCSTMYGAGAEGFMPDQETLNKRAEAMHQMLLKRLAETETPLETFNAQAATINHIAPYWIKAVTHAEEHGVSAWVENLSADYGAGKLVYFHPELDEPAHQPKAQALEKACLEFMAKYPLEFVNIVSADPAALVFSTKDIQDVARDIIFDIAEKSNQFLDRYNPSEEDAKEALAKALEIHGEELINACQHGLHHAQVQVFKEIGPELMAQAFAEGKTNEKDIAEIINDSEGINLQIEQARKRAGLPLDHFSLDASKKVLSIESFGTSLNTKKVIENLQQAKEAKFISEVHLVNGPNRFEFKQVEGAWQVAPSASNTALRKDQVQDVLQAINKPSDLANFLQTGKSKSIASPSKQDAFDR